MSFGIEDIKRVYEEEELKFAYEPEYQLIRFSMNIEATSDVRFIARIANQKTALFTTIFPMNIPEKMRKPVSEYVTMVNYESLVGCFLLDFKDGELSYKVAVPFEETGLDDMVVIRLTYVGFNMFDKFIKGVFAIIYGGKSPQEAFDEVINEDE